MQWDNGGVSIQRVVGFFLFLLSCCDCLAATRQYYIAAEEVTWNYAPSGHDLLTAKPIPRPWVTNLEWPKTRYIEYTDDTFTIKKPQPEWLGILGPIIRAEVGDEVVVHFMNKTQAPRNMHPHGLRYDKNSEGSFYLPFGKGDRVAPGMKYVYHWFANEMSGPAAGQPSSIVWWYHGHVDPGIEVNAGLIGPIIVTAKGQANPDGAPKDVDREFVTSFQIFDQKGGKPDGLFYTINGFIFGNLPGLAMKQGEKVRWHLLAMGNEIDLHTPHWHGETVTYEGRHTDVVELLPASMKTVDMIADNPGSWMFHCHVEDHMEAGMMAIYTIAPPQTRACAVTASGGDFWNDSGPLAVTIKNSTNKTVSSATFVAELFAAPQDLRRPYNMPWSLKKPIPPGQEGMIQQPGSSGSAHGILGWVFFPSIVKFEDGSIWRPQREGECYRVIWRDPDHPDLIALPPRQNEINPD